MGKLLWISAVILLCGCNSRERDIEPLVTPTRELKCPICSEQARLIRFDERDATYHCPEHDIRVDRRNNSFKDATILYKPEAATP